MAARPTRTGRRDLKCKSSSPGADAPEPSWPHSSWDRTIPCVWWNIAPTFCRASTASSDRKGSEMQVLIAGGGRTGAQLAALLVGQNHTVRLVEHRPDILSRIHRELRSEGI